MRRSSVYYAGALGGILAAGLIGCQGQGQTAKPTANAKKKDETPRSTRPEPTPQLSAASYFAYGHLQERQGALEAAIAQYRKALDVQPDFVSARNRLGITLNKLGKHSQAAAEFRKAVTTHPNESYLHNNLGFSLLLQGDFAAAEPPLRQALVLKPDFERARMNLGLVLAKMNRFDEAEVELRRACGEADAFFNMGILLTEAHRYADAARYLEQALAVNPKLDAARKQLTELARLVAQEPEPVTPVTPTPATLNPLLTARDTDMAGPSIATTATPARPAPTPTTIENEYLNAWRMSEGIARRVDVIEAEHDGGYRPTVGLTREAALQLLQERGFSRDGLLAEMGDGAESTPTALRSRDDEASVVMARLLLKLTRQSGNGEGAESPLDGEAATLDPGVQILMTQIYDALQSDSADLEDLLCKLEDHVFPGLRGTPCGE